MLSALGNSWCNLVSWKIMRLIEKGELQAKYNFLHIPKSFRTNTVIEIIEAMVLGTLPLTLEVSQ